MHIGYRVNQRARVIPCRRGRGYRSRNRLQHLLYNLRLQLRDLRLKSLRDGVLNELPHFLLFLVLFHHARENRILSHHPDRDASSAPILTADYTVLVTMSGITSGRVRLRSDFLCDFIPNPGAAKGQSDWANTTVTK